MTGRQLISLLQCILLAFSTVGIVLGTIRVMKTEAQYVRFGYWAITFYANHTFRYDVGEEIWKGEVGSETPLTDEEWEQYKSEAEETFKALMTGRMDETWLFYVGATIYDIISAEHTLSVSNETRWLAIKFLGFKFDDEHHRYYCSYLVYWPLLGAKGDEVSTYGNFWEKVGPDTWKFRFWDPWHLESTDYWLDYPSFYAGPGVTFVEAKAIHDSGEEKPPHIDTATEKSWKWDKNGYISYYEITISYPGADNTDIVSMGYFVFVSDKTVGYVAPGAPDKGLKDRFERHLKQLVEKPVPTPGESTLLVGGPIANRYVTAYNDMLGISWDGFKLVYNGVTYEPVWKSEDYAVLGAIHSDGSFIFLVEGCTRYGTEAAANFIRNHLSELNKCGVYILKWTDTNGNGRYDPFDTVEIIVEP